jgi:hypothetical protein
LKSRPLEHLNEKYIEIEYYVHEGNVIFLVGGMGTAIKLTNNKRRSCKHNGFQCSWILS